MALSGQDPQSRLRSEVDQLSPKVTLVLGNILIQRRWQSRIIPSGGLRVVIHKVHSRGVRESHFPAAWKWSKLRDWLLLDCTITSSILAVHSYVLLPSRIDPGGGAGVVVHKVSAAFRRMTLLPSSWKLACTGGSSTSGDHLSSTGIVGCRGCSWSVRGRRSLRSVG
jgi:hypothetical protein